MHTRTHTHAMAVNTFSLLKYADDILDLTVTSKDYTHTTLQLHTTVQNMQ